MILIAKVYLIECNHEGVVSYKIGKTSRKTEIRLDELNTGNPGELRIIHEFYSEFADQLERSLHRAFKHYNIKGEWFSSELRPDKFLEYCKSLHKALQIVNTTRLS